MVGRSRALEDLVSGTTTSSCRLCGTPLQHTFADLGSSPLANSYLEPEDLVALTIEAAAMARVPLAGTSWVPGAGGM